MTGTNVVSVFHFTDISDMFPFFLWRFLFCSPSSGKKSTPATQRSSAVLNANGPVPKPVAGQRAQVHESGLRSTGVKLEDLERKKRSAGKATSSQRPEQLPFAERLRVFQK